MTKHAFASGAALLWLAGAAVSPAQTGGTLVQLSTRVTATEVPLNRTVTYIIELKWAGELAAIEFDQPETPRVSNFHLSGSASSHWTGLENGQRTSVKTFEYTLRPEALGMGYVESLRLNYLDRAEDQRHTLLADRIGIKVIDPVPEPGEAPLGLALTLGLIATVALAGVAFWWEARRRRQEQARLAQKVALPLEQEYLELLHANVNLNASDTKSGFAELARLLRQYLYRALNLPAPGAATAEVLALYGSMDVPQAQVQQLEEILQTCEVVKFSGESGDPARLARVYALTENFLRARLPAPATIPPASGSRSTR